MRSNKLILVAAILMSGCREPDGVLGGASGQIQVSSDPTGARIILDNTETGAVTPDTVLNISGIHDVLTQLDAGGAAYTYYERVTLHGIEPYVMSGPLTARCLNSGTSQQACYARNRFAYSAGNMTFKLNATGTMLTEDAVGRGLFWPAGSQDSYASNAMPLIAAKVGGRSVAIGMYDIASLAGRPALVVDNSGGGLKSDQKSWIVPVSTSTTLATMRGIEIREQVLIDPSVPDVALVKITYRNITNSPSYQKLDARGSSLGTEGLTYDDVYLGFGIDPDIGTADDDAVTYDPSLHAVFSYDMNFSDSRISENAPGLIGLRMLSAPNGANVLLNSYGNANANAITDWHASEATETLGWGVMSGTASYAPDDPDPTIGTLVAGPTDVRMLVSAGPYTLRPSEQLTIVVAIALAQPSTGTYTPGVAVSPGDPHDAGRTIMSVAAALRQKLTDAINLLPKISIQ